MDCVLDDRYLVFVRSDPRFEARPDASERPIATCATYGEARHLRRKFQEAGRSCAIRYVGPAGGGD
jgi:hypothetical protein